MKIEEFKQKLQSSLNFLSEELKSFRTGRANPGLVEDLKVNYYETPTLLKQLAAINTPEPRLIIISPYDKSILGEIEKAIEKSDLNLRGTNDGNVVRINIPSLTEERREELIKSVHNKAEEARIAMRNIRREVIEEIEAQEKSGEITEDDRFSGEKEIQKILDEFIVKVDDLISQKEQEMREV